MRVDIPFETCVETIADKYLNFQGIQAPREKNQKKNAIEFNATVLLFNGSTCAAIAFTIAALAGAAFVSTAIAWGSIALALRYLAEKHINHFAQDDSFLKRANLQDQVNRQRDEMNEVCVEGQLRGDNMIPMIAVAAMYAWTKFSAGSFNAAPSRAEVGRKEQILENCRIDKGTEWRENEVIALGMPVWKNMVQVPV